MSSADIIQLVATVIKIVLFSYALLLPLVAISVVFERRFASIIQDRVGPNRIRIPLPILDKIPTFGIIQPMADGIKFLLKEDFTPQHVRKLYFWIAPCLVMIPSLLTIGVIPFAGELTIPGWPVIKMVIADINVGPLFVFAISSFAVYGITLAGWASNSKYPFLGGVRSTAQMISYEICLGLSIIPILMIYSQLNLSNIVSEQSANGWLLLPLWGNGLSAERLWLLIPAVLAFIIFTTSIFAETNRTPFDLPECETELVGGYHTEYSSMKFALFFLGEYAAMIVGSALIVTLFFGGWSLPFGWDGMLSNWANGDALRQVLMVLLQLGCFIGKIIAFVLFFIWVRWTVPRFRYDQLMKLGWVVFFELAVVNIFITAIILYANK